MPGPSVLPALALLAACGPRPERGLQHNYDALPEECRTREFAEWIFWMVGPDGESSHPTWSDPCVQALEVDIGLDRASCTDSTGPDDMISDCSVLSSVFKLAWLDFGAVDELDRGVADYHGDYVHEPFMDAVRSAAVTLGHDRVGPTLYDMVTSTIDGVAMDEGAVPDADGDVAEVDGLGLFVNVDSHRVTLTGDAARWEYGVGALVHAMGHVWTGHDHEACAESFYTFSQDDYAVKGDAVCDGDWQGAWAMSVGAMTLGFEYGDDDDFGYPADMAGFAVLGRCFINGEPCLLPW